MTATSPNTHWVSPDSLVPENNKIHARIQALLATAKFDYLQEMVLHFRKVQDQNVSANVTCTIERKTLTFGMHNLVMKVVFSDNTNWVARVSHTPIDPSAPQERTKSMLSEIATMKTLKSRTTIPVPAVFGFDTSPSNPFGFPYILMECMTGRILNSTIASQVPNEYFPRITRQLADVLFQLENLTFDRLGRIWCGENCDGELQIIPWEVDGPFPNAQTSLEWFFAYRQDQNRSALKTNADDPEWKTACWVLKSAISQIIAEDRNHGPFPLCHFDLHYGNLLFDDDYNLTAVLDWSQTGTAPLERLAVSPEFITFPGISDAKNKIIFQFRDAVRAVLQEKVMEARQSSSVVGPRTTLSMILGSKRADITHRCTYSRPYRAIYDGRMVAKLIFGDHVSWEQLVAVYGGTEPY